MNKISKAAVRKIARIAGGRKNPAVAGAPSRTKTWCWRRWIPSNRQDFWVARLEAAGRSSWAFVERPGRVRVLLEVYANSRAGAEILGRQWGGRVQVMELREWFRPCPAPTTIGRQLEIVHGELPARNRAVCPRLVIPHGLAFGSGEHATTYMLLRALACHGFEIRSPVRGARILDLGTGSGVLALAARLFGAKRIVATDFDPQAVGTARQNEVLNFSCPLIRWRRADVRRLRAKARYDVVLANLFSGILVEAAPQIARSVSSNGELWLSGILATQQQREVVAAYRGQGLRLMRTVQRGKWIMLMLEPARSNQDIEGGEMKTTQVK